MKYFPYLSFVVIGISIYLNSISLPDIIFLVVGSVITIPITLQFPFKQNLAKYVVLLANWISVVLMPALHLCEREGEVFTSIDYNRLTSFGAKVFLITSLSVLIVGLLGNKKKTTVVSYTPRPLSKSFFYKFFALAFLLTGVSYTLGLGKMGADAVVLPFHLGGFINIFRSSIVATMFAIIVENHILRKVKVPKSLYVVFLLWTLFEVIAWLSKSKLTSSFLPVFVILYLYYKPNLKTIGKYILPFVVAVLLMYPIIGAMRHYQTGSLSKDIFEARAEVSDSEEHFYLLSPLNRIFMTGHQYMADFSYFNSDALFDFSRLGTIMAIGGSAGYQTFVIDGFPPGVNHSSGSSGLMDPILVGGLGLCLLMILLNTIFAAFVDNSLPKRQYVIYFVLLMLVFQFSVQYNVSIFFNGVGFQYLLGRIVVIIVAYKLNYNRRIKYIIQEKNNKVLPFKLQ